MVLYNVGSAEVLARARGLLAGLPHMPMSERRVSHLYVLIHVMLTVAEIANSTS